MMQLSTATEITRGVLIGDDRKFDGVTIDSRGVNPGDLFVAIPGEKFDGHDYIANAIEHGASGALVETMVDLDCSQVKVEDTTIALGRLAQSWRQRFEIPVLAITGSNGKTSVTAMVQQIISVEHNPLSPRESFNNHWGVPLTLLKLNDNHSHAVIEMGMNHLGEIDYLTRITRPTTALITNAAAAHLEGLGSVEQVAQAKAEIINGVAQDGVVVVNADDAFCDYWTALASDRKVIRFALDHDADITAANLHLQPDHSVFDLMSEAESISVKLPIPGRHNVANALAAAALCHSAGISISSIAAGLAAFSGVPGRLNFGRTARGAGLIDDSFNANPSSTAAAIEVLTNQPGTKILVLGAMAELGATGRELHAEIGAFAAKAKIDRLLVLDDVGNADVHGYVDGFGDKTELFTSPEDLLTAIESDDCDDSYILVKGSKSSRMGRIVDDLGWTENNYKEAQC